MAFSSRLLPPRLANRTPGVCSLRLSRRGVAARPDWTFWTLTIWDSAEDMRGYIKTGDHKEAMPKLIHWCDEASIVHWEQPDLTVPSWPEADARMRREGRPSKVRHPTPAHLAMAFAPPRSRRGAPLTPRRSA